MFSNFKKFIKKDNQESLPLTHCDVGPSTSRNYGSIVDLLKKKLSLASFHHHQVKIAYHKLFSILHSRVCNTCY